MMPPGYQTRFAEIQRLSEELQGIDRIARLIWETGPTLQEAVRDAFTSLKFDVEFTPETAPQVIVKLDGKRRLLLHVRSADGAIDKKTPELSQAFQSLQETSGSDDRVVLAANAHPNVAPPDRPDPITPEALNLITRMGVNFVTTATLFTLWTMSQQDQQRGRAFIDKLHAQDGGTFKPPS